MSSFIKYYQEKASPGGGNLYWGRAGIDGAPFRGPTPKLTKDEEFEDKAERVLDYKTEIFDLSDPEARKTYEEICDRIANGWYILIHRERKFSPVKGSWLALIEYAVAHMEMPPQYEAGR